MEDYAKSLEDEMQSLSSRRAWIEIDYLLVLKFALCVALLAESVD